MMRVALKGLLGRKLRAALTAIRDRPRRRDDQRGASCSPTRSAKSFDGVYQGVVQVTDAVITSNQADRHDVTTADAPFSAALLRGVQVCRRARRPGLDQDEARLVDADGKPIGAAGGLAVAVQPDRRTTALNPLSSSDGRGRTATGDRGGQRPRRRQHPLAVGDTVGAFAHGPVAPLPG